MCLKHIFEPFCREHIDAGTKYTGTGLGMAITKEPIGLMGGTIKAESRLGEGSDLTVEIHNAELFITKNPAQP